MVSRLLSARLGLSINMSDPRYRTKRLRSRFLRSRSGSAAVEFALIAPVFFALMFSLMEAGWLMTKIALTENAVAEIGRDIYRGAAQANSANQDTSITQGSLKQRICSSIPVIPNCVNNVTLEVTTIRGFNDVPSTSAPCQYSFSSLAPPVTTYNPGGSAEISLVRVCITTDVLFPGLGIGLQLPKNLQGRYEIVTSLAFLNEPF